MRILVPVLAWRDTVAMVPFVASVGRGNGASVRFVHVRPIPSPREGKWGRLVATTDQEMERLCARAQTELKEAAVLLGRISAESVMRFGDASEEIPIEAAAWCADLIAMSSGSARGLGPRWPRSVTRAVLRRSPVPVLLCQPPRIRRTDRLGRLLEWAWTSGPPDRAAIGIEAR